MTLNPCDRTQDWVLLVEDDPDHALLSRRSIEDLGLGIQVIHRSTIGEALKCLDANTDRVPIAAFVDINLCGESGLDLVSLIRCREGGCATRIVMLTCVFDDTARGDALARSADAFVCKPLATARARTLLQENCYRWEIADLPSDLSAYRALRPRYV